MYMAIYYIVPRTDLSYKKDFEVIVIHGHCKIMHFIIPDVGKKVLSQSFTAG